MEFGVVGWKEGRCVGIGAGVGSISSVGPTSEAEASVAQGGEDEKKKRKTSDEPS